MTKPNVKKLILRQQALVETAANLQNICGKLATTRGCMRLDITAVLLRPYADPSLNTPLTAETLAEPSANDRFTREVDIRLAAGPASIAALDAKAVELLHELTAYLAQRYQELAAQSLAELSSLIDAELTAAGSSEMTDWFIQPGADEAGEDEDYDEDFDEEDEPIMKEGKKRLPPRRR